MKVSSQFFRPGLAMLAVASLAAFAAACGGNK